MYMCICVCARVSCVHAGVYVCARISPRTKPIYVHRTILSVGNPSHYHPPPILLPLPVLISFPHEDSESVDLSHVLFVRISTNVLVLAIDILQRGFRDGAVYG